jgi:error-prone DNA polymerase
VKLHYPAEFVCALLNAQPMGFYSPHTLVRDAVRHGVQVLGPCVHASRKDCTLEPRTADVDPIGTPRPGWHADQSVHAVRTGLRYVRGLSDGLLDRIDAEHERPRPFTEPLFKDLADFTRRTGAPTDALEALATAGAFAGFGVERREALWAAGALRDAQPLRRSGIVADKLPGLAVGVEAPPLPGMTDVDVVAADLWATGMSPGKHPTEFVREELAARGVVTTDALRELPDRSIVEVAGVVTHRQQPETARGIVFLNLEDEGGLVNIVCMPDVWKRFRTVARGAKALRVRGVLERKQDVINVLAHRIDALSLRPADLLRSRDFR